MQSKISVGRSGERMQYEVRWWIANDCRLGASGRLGAIFLESQQIDSRVQQSNSMHGDIPRRKKEHRSAILYVHRAG